MFSYDICEIDGQTYFFYPNGALGIGWCSWTETYSDGYSWTYWFYANSSGVLQNGWQKIGSVWYYFDLDDYDMYCDDWYEIDGKAYYFDRSGKMCTGWCSYSESYPDGYSWTEWYYANSSGVLQTGWQWIGGVWYYFNPEYYYMYTGVKKIGEETHAFDSNGAWLENKRGWLEVKNGSDTTWYYILPDGTGATGWQTINGAKY